MCGIVGVLRFGALNAPANRASALFMATNLLESSETRGKDATGVATLFDDGNFFVQKMGISATEFVARVGGQPDDFEGLMAVLRGYDKASMRCFIGHCRKKSAGGLNNVDNHPIKAGNIIGVHNGTLKNQDMIFKNLDCQRDGKVDSEAIFRLLQYYSRDCEDPFTLDMVEETCKRLEGTFSILAFNANNPNQVITARDGRPAEYCLIKPLGIVLVASEKKFLDRAIYSYNKMARLFPTGNPATTFTALKQADVEYGDLANDTIGLFNLTHEVTATTKLKDLYDTRKIPFPSARLWKSTVTTTYTNGYKNRNTNYGTGVSSGNTGTAGTAKKNQSTAGQGAASQTDTNTGAQKPTKPLNGSPLGGKVWSDNLEKFVDAFGKKEEVADGVVLDTEKETKSPLEKASDAVVLDKADLSLAKKGNESEVKKTEESANKMDTYLTEETAIGVEGFLVSDGEAPITTIKPIDNSSTVKAVTKSSTASNKEVMTAMKEGIEKGKKVSSTERAAKEAAKEVFKKVEKFETIHEVAEFVGTDATSIKQLPIQSLVNRVIKNAFVDIFVAGYKAGNSIKVPDNSEKLSKAQKHIRILKALNGGVDSILSDEFIKRSGLKHELLGILDQWGKGLLGKTEVSVAALNEVFNAGDIRSSEALKRIATAINKE